MTITLAAIKATLAETHKFAHRSANAISDADALAYFMNWAFKEGSKAQTQATDFLVSLIPSADCYLLDAMTLLTSKCLREQRGAILKTIIKADKLESIVLENMIDQIQFCPEDQQLNIACDIIKSETAKSHVLVKLMQQISAYPLDDRAALALALATVEKADTAMLKTLLEKMESLGPKDHVTWGAGHFAVTMAIIQTNKLATDGLHKVVAQMHHYTDGNKKMIALALYKSSELSAPDRKNIERYLPEKPDFAAFFSPASMLTS